MTNAQAALAQVREALRDEALHDPDAALSDTIDAIRALIAACSPANMTAILAHVEAQEAEIERLTAERDDHARWRADLADKLHDRETTISAAWEALRSAGVHSEATIDDGIRLLRRQLDEAGAECNEAQTLCDKLAGILGRTVDALRGAPPPLTHWSWHDLPERAEAMRAERDELRAALKTCVWALRQPLDGWKGECERKALDAANAVLRREK